MLNMTKEFIWNLFNQKNLIQLKKFLLIYYFFFFTVFEYTKKCKQIREQVIADSKYDPMLIFQLLINTAQFELKIKELFKMVSKFLL